MVTKIRENRTAKKRSSGKTNPNHNRMIPLEEIESFGATEIKKAYIEEMKGSVYYINTKAKGVIKFMEAETGASQLRAMANFIACSYCTEDGKLIYSSEEEVIGALTRPSITSIAFGIAKSWQESEGIEEGNG